MINRIYTIYFSLGLAFLFLKCGAHELPYLKQTSFPWNPTVNNRHSDEEQLYTLPSLKSKFIHKNERKKISSLLTKMVVKTKKIEIPGYSKAHNPSIIPDGNEYILTFRLQPSTKKPWISYIGIVRLNRSFEIISEPQIIDPRTGLARKSPSQAEDARIFEFKGEIYVIYNDNEMVTNPTSKERRDMYLAKVVKHGSHYRVEPPIKLMHEKKYASVLWQKNWTPFVWNGNLMISYSYKPHEVLLVDIETGICKPCYEAETPTKWKFGQLRGGSPALLVDGQYLTFYHSGMITKSYESNYQKMFHYYMGALTFKAEPPFEVTKMTPAPIVGKGFYTISNFHKRIIYPGGFVVDGKKIHVVYGKDDSQVWVATIDRDKLNETLLPPRYNLE